MLKDKKKSLSGKSLLFNSIAVLLNLIAVVLLVLGFHESYAETGSGLALKIIGFVLLSVSIGAVIIFEGWLLFAYVSRVVVGGLFIVSGLIKANDPKGFAYKLEEYFEDGALAYRVKELFGWESFSLEFLIDQALMLSILICILEILLGALIILGRRIKIASWLMLGMMVFFTLLTWHTKECDPNSTFNDVDTYALTSPEAQAKIPQAENNENITILSKTASDVTIREVKKPQCVDDCGCFGDALKGSIGRSLTPAESFWKDLVLLYLVLVIFISRRKITPNNTRENTVLIFFSLLFVGFFSYIFSWSFPLLFALVILLFALWIKRTGGNLLGNDLGVFIVIVGICALFVTYVLMYRPLKDYRPYHVGSNLIERMSDGEQGEYNNVLVYKNKSTDIDTTFTALDESTKYIWGDKDKWEFVERRTIAIKEAILPSIQQFNPVIDFSSLTSVEQDFDYIEKVIDSNRVKFVDVVDKKTGDRYPQLLEEFYIDDWDTSKYVIGDTLLRVKESLNEISLKNHILGSNQIILVISRNLDNGNFSRIERLKEIADNARKKNIDMIMISTATKTEIKAFRDKYGLEIPTVQNDDTELKAITRSNPTLMVLKKGTIVGKYPFRSTPSWDWLVKNALDIQ
jgi:uncharacterized membrane protein YphA (DoxX/SURF4 family)